MPHQHIDLTRHVESSVGWRPCTIFVHVRAFVSQNTPRVQSCVFLGEIQHALMKSIGDINDAIADSGNSSRIEINTSAAEIAPDVICKNH